MLPVDLVAVRMRPIETFLWCAKAIMPMTHMVLVQSARVANDVRQKKI